MVGTRYISHAKKEEPLSLYYSTGTRYICEGGVCRMEQTHEADHSAMIVSEKLTDLRSDWHKVPGNNFVVVHDNITVTVHPIKITA